MKISSSIIEELEKYIEDNKIGTKYNDLNFDVQAEVSFISTENGGKNKPVISGYRPNHKIKIDYLTTGLHKYCDKDMVFPGETAFADIKFISPEDYPSCLSIGQIINIQEGSKVVGYAKVIRIYNKKLEIIS